MIIYASTCPHISLRCIVFGFFLFCIKDAHPNGLLHSDVHHVVLAMNTLTGSKKGVPHGKNLPMDQLRIGAYD